MFYEREHKDKIRARQRRYAQANRDKARERQRRYEERHGVRVRAEKRQRYAEVSADPEKAAARREGQRRYYLANRGRLIEQKRQKQEEYNAYRRRSDHRTANWRELLDGLWEAQGGRCYLCGDPLDREANRAIHLDHDHRCCGFAKSCERCRRGLACRDCNHLIARAQDDPERLRRIADNLERAYAEVTRRMQRPRDPLQERSYEFTCQECGKPFTAHRTDVLCCSTRCYERLRNRERAEGKLARGWKPGVQMTCERCGATFTTTRPEVAKYCSKRCCGAASVARRAPRKTKAAPVACRECGQTFIAQMPERARYCSKRCSKRAYAKRKTADRDRAVA